MLGGGRRSGSGSHSLMRRPTHFLSLPVSPLHLCVGWGWQADITEYACSSNLCRHVPPQPHTFLHAHDVPISLNICWYGVWKWLWRFWCQWRTTGCYWSPSSQNPKRLHSIHQPDQNFCKSPRKACIVFGMYEWDRGDNACSVEVRQGFCVSFARQVDQLANGWKAACTTNLLEALFLLQN